MYYKAGIIKIVCGLEDSSALKNTDCSSENPGSGPSTQRQLNNHRIYNSSSRGPNALSGLQGHQAHIWCTNTRAGKAPTHKTKTSESLKKVQVTMEGYTGWLMTQADSLGINPCICGQTVSVRWHNYPIRTKKGTRPIELLRAIKRPLSHTVNYKTPTQIQELKQYNYKNIQRYYIKSITNNNTGNL